MIFCSVSSTIKEKDDLKCKAGKQLDKTLEDENDRLKSQLNKLNCVTPIHSHRKYQVHTRHVQHQLTTTD
jgi:hypothetical protein